MVPLAEGGSPSTDTDHLREEIVHEGHVEPNEGPWQPRPAPRARLWWGSAAVLLIALGVLGAWLWTSGTWAGWRSVARVDDERITRAELEDHLAVLVKQGRIRQEALADPVRAKEVERVALEDLILRRLLLAEAERLKIVVEPGEEDMAFNKAHGAQFGESKLPEAAKKTGGDANRLRLEVRRQLLMTRLAEKITEGVTVSDDEMANYYEGHHQAFYVPEMVRLRLLIVDSREEAERLRAQLRNGADFAALAREHSKGGAKDRGGDMGWVDPRMLPAAIATAVAAIPRTGITPVIEAKGGFYVVRIEGRQAPRELSLVEAKDQIRKQLTAERKQAKFAKWVQERRRSARIQVFL